ncbi:PREDICTED: F-box protein At3g07870-like [Fragaria vesca subsp. vesca]
MDPPLFLDLKALENIKNGDDVWSAVTELDFPVWETIPESGFRRVVGSCNGLVLPNPLLVTGLKDSYKKFNGFGYDSATDDYKVIRGFAYDANGAKKFMIQIFALKTGSWRTVKDIDYVDLTKMQGLFLNGALHWLGDLPEPDGDTRILSFDLGAEKFQETIQLPYADRFTHLLIHRNCLCACSCPTESINIWMMKEYGVKESWTEIVQFSLENYVLNCVLDPDEFNLLVRPVCILENGVFLIDRMGGRKPGNVERVVVFSNLQEKTFEHFVKVTQDSDFTTFIYQETLVSPDIPTNKTNIVSLLYPLSLQF